MDFKVSTSAIIQIENEGLPNDEVDHGGKVDFRDILE